MIGKPNHQGKRGSSSRAGNRIRVDKGHRQQFPLRSLL
jgi:hypothetical protein